MKRRNLLKLIGMGAVGVGTAGWWNRNDILRSLLVRRQNEGVVLSGGPSPGEDMCVLTPEQAEGPFFINAPARSDITEDRVGLPLELRLQIVAAQDCSPIEGAVAEVWHCDASGRYSGYRDDLTRHPMDTLLYLDGPDSHVEPVNDRTYLRGAQSSDANGMITFKTIFPGWYEPRATHIHVKLFIDDKAYLTSQLYFPDELVKRIYGTHEDYLPHGKAPYTHGNDMVLGRWRDANGLLLTPEEQDGGLIASVKLGIARAQSTAS